MKSLVLVFVIGVSGALCAMQGQGTKRSTHTTKKPVKNRNNRGRTQAKPRKDDTAIKSFLAAKYCSKKK